MTTFTLSTTLSQPYDEAVNLTRQALAEQGFGILTEIDLRATLKTKLDVDVAPQVILGACRPALAYEALSVEPSIAAVLPCNVVVRALNDQTTLVEAFDPDAMMGLADFARSYPSQLSGGMRQRVCIARTLVAQPRLILLDEPFGALDQQTRLLMGDEMLRLWRQTGATVFLITHALDEAAMLADRIGVMSARPGRLIDNVETLWPRDRDSRIVEREEFGVVTSRLWKSLREESMKTMGRMGASA